MDQPVTTSRGSIDVKSLPQEDQKRLADQLHFLLFQQGQNVTGKTLDELITLCQQEEGLAQQLKQALDFIAYTQDSNKKAASPVHLLTRTIAIICVKSHEYTALSALIQKLVVDKELPTVKHYSIQKWSSNWCAHEDVYYFNKGKESPEFKLILVCYGDVQGPVVTASRVGHLVNQYKPDMVGMTGVCAGRQLGTVYVAFEAICPEFGHVLHQQDAVKAGLQTDKLQSAGNGYFYIPQQGTKWKAHDRVADDIIQKFHYNDILTRIQQELGTQNNDFSLTQTSKNDINISGPAILYSYNQVRNDCEEEIVALKKDEIVLCQETDPQCGIDMEAQALFHTLLLLNVKALPVIKAVSDVGGEQMTFDYNEEQFKSHCGDQPMTHKKMRENYRSHAAENAAKVMAAFIRHLVETPGFKDLRPEIN